MIFDVGDPAANLVLALCFWLIILLAAVSVVPWRTFGGDRLARWVKWTWLPVLALAIIYETAMPARFDIRIDLLLLLPLYLLVVASCAFRWWRGRRSRG